MNRTKNPTVTMKCVQGESGWVASILCGHVEIESSGGTVFEAAKKGLKELQEKVLTLGMSTALGQLELNLGAEEVEESKKGGPKA